MTKRKGKIAGQGNRKIVIGSYETVSVADTEAIKAAGLNVHTDGDTELVSVSAEDVAAQRSLCGKPRLPSRRRRRSGRRGQQQ